MKPGHYKGFYLTEYDVATEDGGEAHVVEASISMGFTFGSVKEAEEGIDTMIGDLTTARRTLAALHGANTDAVLPTLRRVQDHFNDTAIYEGQPHDSPRP